MLIVVYFLLCLSGLYMLCYIIIVHNTYFFFFFKQKTAYEMRISDWSSDVCSSDLFARDHRHGDDHQQGDDERDERRGLQPQPRLQMLRNQRRAEEKQQCARHEDHRDDRHEKADRQLAVLDVLEIGRASCRERVCQYV